MTKDEALKLALEALTYCEALNRPVHEQKMHAVTSIKKALAQPEQEPVAAYTCGVCGVSMQMERSWVGLTNEDVSNALTKYHGWREFAQHLEDILKEKNT